jgi:transcriptional regulator, propionate catabolism operon regulatory protein
LQTKILAVTHRNFAHLYYEVIEMLNLPLQLEVIEVGFGELNNIDTKMFTQFDLVITSGAHLEMLNKEYHELTYLVPFYPLHFTEADLVKGLVEAKKFGENIMLMYFPDETHDLTEFEEVLHINVKRLMFSTIKEAEELMMEHYKKGYKAVVGTSSICEIAKKNGIDSVLIYSKDSLKLEIIKAYQFASTKNKMVSYAKEKDAILQHALNPIFLLDHEKRIIDTNMEGVKFLKRKAKHDVIGEIFETLVPIQINSDSKDSLSFQYEKVQMVVEPIVLNANNKSYVVIVRDSHPGLTMERNKTALNSRYQFKDIIHTSSNMKKMLLKAQQFAQSDAPLLIIGESGTGKELIAHSAHHYSKRKSQPFLPVNCSAIPENILESELFGYDEGAFTGARKGGKPGFFEMAQHGTIFLDEIGELPLDIQTKLLRVLQEKEVIRLGGKNIIPLDVRVITATNKPLIELVRKKAFREDLYYRINVLQINVPPVRQRKEDIPLILKHLLIKYGMDSYQSKYLINIAKDSILSYSWPGNIREMENFAQRFCAVSSISSTTYDLVKSFTDILAEFLEHDRKIMDEDHSQLIMFDSERSLSNPIELEKLKIINILVQTNGNKYKAAEMLGMSRTTLWRKIKQFNIEMMK